MSESPLSTDEISAIPDVEEDFSDYWREIKFSDDAHVLVSNGVYDLIEKSGVDKERLGELIMMDIDAIERNPRGERSIDPLKNNEYEGYKRWINKLRGPLTTALGFPEVAVKKSLGDTREDLVYQFGKMLELRSKAEEVFTPEQKKELGLAEVYAVVTVSKPDGIHQYLFMEKVPGERMDRQEPVPESMAEAFGIAGNKATDPRGWGSLTDLLVNMGVKVNDFGPKNTIKTPSQEEGLRPKYVAIDQGLKITENR